MTGDCRSPGGEKCCSGAHLTPEGTIPRHLRTKSLLGRAFDAREGVSYIIPSKPPLGRHFLAGGHVLAARAYETLAAASNRRLRARFGSNGVRNRRCGVNLAPEGTFWQQGRTKPSLRRQPGAGGRIIAARAYESGLPALLGQRRPVVLFRKSRTLPLTWARQIATMAPAHARLGM